MAIHIIAALTHERVIGDKGTIPWNILEDMQLFKGLTTGSVVIMGKNTWNSLPDKFRPLPNRINIIVSTSLPPQAGATVCANVTQALLEAKKSGKEIFCIGGGQLYKEFLPHATILHLSWVKEKHAGDTYFPEFDLSAWNEQYTQEFPLFSYKRYTRK